MPRELRTYDWLTGVSKSHMGKRTHRSELGYLHSVVSEDAIGRKTAVATKTMAATGKDKAEIAAKYREVSKTRGDDGVTKRASPLAAGSGFPKFQFASTKSPRKTPTTRKTASPRKTARKTTK